MNLSTTQTYEMAVSPPPAMPWKEYAARVEAEWAALLNSPEGASEASIQTFLETHPSMVPGAQSMSGTSGHSAFPTALIKQPKLPGFSDRFPDFMWIAADSGTIYAVVVEIESPKKLWFNRNGTQTADFSQAHNQLTEWRIWFEEPRNQQAFLAHYNPPAQFRRFLPQYVLVYGRRAEFERRPDSAGKRQHLQRSEEYFMSFDRLRPISTSEEYITVESKKDGYRAISIPATIELGPRNADNRSLIADKVKAVDSSPFMTEERKAFLKRRFAYWDDWANQYKQGLINLGDRE